jgi:hypothetical protein
MRDFLDFLMPDEGFVEVRSIKDGKVKQWWSASRQAAVDLAIEQSDLGWDAYYGVLPRLNDHDGDAEHVVPTSTVLWTDLDAKTIGSKQRALQSLIRFRIPPSVVVDSGHGYHAYWKLTSPAPFSRARLAMIGLARTLNGDHVYDQARILRIPGTVNWKDPEKPVPVRTVVFNTTQVLRFKDFHAQVEGGYEDQLPPQPSPGTRYASYDRRDMPEWLSELIRDGRPQGERSEACWKVMCQLIKRGWTDAEILHAFETGGIGEKMREMRTGDKWFDYSLNKARAQA